MTIKSQTYKVSSFWINKTNQQTLNLKKVKILAKKLFRKICHFETAIQNSNFTRNIILQTKNHEHKSYKHLKQYNSIWHSLYSAVRSGALSPRKTYKLARLIGGSAGLTPREECARWFTPFLTRYLLGTAVVLVAILRDRPVIRKCSWFINSE